MNRRFQHGLVVEDDQQTFFRLVGFLWVWGDPLKGKYDTAILF